jgi:hypothetical protein
MSSVVRSADSLHISSSNISSSEVSDGSVRYCGRSDVSVSKAFSPAIATDAGFKADADHEHKTSFDAVFGHACSAGSVLTISIEEESVPCRDVKGPPDLESSCLVLDPCQNVTHVCNCCEAPPDEDGFCRGLCFSCFVKYEDQLSTSSCSSDDESDEANDILVCSACDAVSDENGFCHGLCYDCFLQQDTENNRFDWSVLEEQDVSRVVVGCFPDAYLRDADSDQHDDMVQCGLLELKNIIDVQSVYLDAMVYSVEDLLDQLPDGYCAGGRREQLDVFIELLEMFTSWNGA